MHSDHHKRFVSGLAQPENLMVTLRYASPELFSLKTGQVLEEVHKKADVFSFALTVYEIIHRKPGWSYDSREEFMKRILDNERPSIAPEIQCISNSPSGRRLLKPILEILHRSWKCDPAERPSSKEILDLLLEDDGSVQ
jgi:hypothetical protein